MKTRELTEVAVLIAVAVVLEVVFTGMSAFFPFLMMPYGGRISLSMLPLIIIAYRHGYAKGILGGVVYSLFNLLLDGVLWHWASFFLDYVIAFGAIGLGYVGVQLFGKNKKGFIALTVIGITLRFVSSWLSGWILFAEYMPEEFDSPYLYSLVYNAYYLIPSMILIIFVGVGLFKNIVEFE